MSNNVYPQGNTIDYNFMFRVAQGLVPGWDYIRKFGSGDVKTSLTSVWSGSAEQTGLYEYPDDAGIPMQIFSSSANDTVFAGTGAKIVQISGISPDLEDFQEEFVELNGTTPVTLANNYSRIQRMSVVDCGNPEGMANVGNLQVTDLGNNVLYSYILDGGRAYGQTSQAMFTLPTKYQGYFTNITLSSNNNKQTSLYVYGRNPAASIGYPPEYNVPFRMAYEEKVRDSTWDFQLPVPEVIYPGQDVEVRGDTDDGSGTDQCAAQFYIVYYKLRG